eukprot:14279543-Heterocapsa_arctica.AAC.1
MVKVFKWKSDKLKLNMKISNTKMKITNQERVEERVEGEDGDQEREGVVGLGQLKSNIVNQIKMNDLQDEEEDNELEGEDENEVEGEDGDQERE